MLHSSYPLSPFSPDEHGEPSRVGTPCIATSNDTSPVLRSSPERSRQLVVPHGICQVYDEAALPANTTATAGRVPAIKNCKSPLEALIDNAQATRTEDPTAQRRERPAVRPKYLLPVRYSCYQSPACRGSNPTALDDNTTQKSATSSLAASFDGASETASLEDVISEYESFGRAIPLNEQFSSAKYTKESTYATWAGNETFRPRSSVYSRQTAATRTASNLFTTIRGLREDPPPLPSPLPAAALGKLGYAFTHNQQKATRQGESKTNQDIRRPPHKDLRFISSSSPLTVRHNHTNESFRVAQQRTHTSIPNQDTDGDERIIGDPQEHSIITDRKHMSRGWWDIMGHPFSIDGKSLQNSESMTRFGQMDGRAAADSTSITPIIVEPEGADDTVLMSYGVGEDYASDHLVRQTLIPPKTIRSDKNTAQLANDVPRANLSHYFCQPQPSRPPIHARRGLQIPHIHTSRNNNHQVRRNVRESQMRKQREQRPSNNITIQTINFITGGGNAKANQHPTIQSFSPIVNTVCAPPPLKLPSQKEAKPQKQDSALHSEPELGESTPVLSDPKDLRIHGPALDAIPATGNQLQQPSDPARGFGNAQVQGSKSLPHNVPFPVHNPAILQEQRAAQYESAAFFPSTLNRGRAVGESLTADNGRLAVHKNHLPPYSPTDPRYDPIAAAAYVAATTVRPGKETNAESSIVMPEATMRRENNGNGFLAPPPLWSRGSRPDSLDIFSGAAVLKEPQPVGKEPRLGNVNQRERDGFFSERSQPTDMNGCRIPPTAAPNRQPSNNYHGNGPFNEVAGHGCGIRGSSIESNHPLRDVHHLRNHSQQSNISENHSANSQFTSHTRFSDKRLFRSTRTASYGRSESNDTFVDKLPKMNHVADVRDNDTTVMGKEKGKSRKCKTCFCIPTSSSSKRKRRCFWIIIIIIILLIIAASIATPLIYRALNHDKSRWVHPDGYPALPTGVLTIAGTRLSQSRNDCILPSTIWSCSLPKEARVEKEGHKGDQPDFVISIKYQNPNDTKASDTQAIESDNLVSWPEVPVLTDMEFMGNTTDGVEGPKYGGESTPFWVTFVSPLSTVRSSSASSSSASSQKRSLRRDDNNSTSSGNDGNHDDNGEPLIQANMTSPNPDIFIPRPKTSSNGTALPAQLYPLAKNQPLRLYNRGSEDEYYGFYTYFERRIFLAGLTSSDNDTDVADEDGGSTMQEAKAGCFWGSTRFFVQIWTSSSESSKRHLIGSAHVPSEDLESSEPFSLSSASADNFSQPGSFPFPVTISIDRHGGVTHDKMVYCYALDEKKRYILDQNRVVDENRGKGGKLIDAAPDLYLSKSNKRNIAEEKANVNGQANGDSIDGGTGGCVCQYRNWT